MLFYLLEDEKCYSVFAPPRTVTVILMEYGLIKHVAPFCVARQPLDRWPWRYHDGFRIRFYIVLMVILSFSFIEAFLYFPTSMNSLSLSSILPAPFSNFFKQGEDNLFRSLQAPTPMCCKLRKLFPFNLRIYRYPRRAIHSLRVSYKLYQRTWGRIGVRSGICKSEKRNQTRVRELRGS